MIIRPDGRPPFRADHIGSLLRPAGLRHAFREFHAGRMEQAEFGRIQDEAIRGVVKLQESVGLKVVTDGEFRRGSYWGRFVELTEGLSVREAVFRFRDEHGNEAEFTAPHVVGKVRRRKPITVDEFVFVKPLTSATPKITMPSPSTMHFYRCGQYADPDIYPDPTAFFVDLGKVYQGEIAELHAAGARYVQIDEVAIAMLCDPRVRDRVKTQGLDPELLVDLYVDAINEAAKNCPADMVIGLHLCRGNFKGRYLSEGGYDSIADKLFNRSRVNHFLLEYDTARAGNFAPLRLLPKNKGVVLGLVSSKVPELESIDELERRVQEASKFVDTERLAISPQCGFASTVAGNSLTEGDEIAKLRSCVEAAERIWS